MKRNLLIAFTAFLLISSCKSKDAFKYSEALVAKEKSLEASIAETEKKAAEYISENNWDSMVAVSQRMVSLIDDKLKEVKNEKAPDVKEAENFKKAVVDYFEYMKGIYTGYVNYGSAASEEERDAEREKIKEMMGDKENVLKQIQTAQKKYADANGFKVQ